MGITYKEDLCYSVYLLSNKTVDLVMTILGRTMSARSNNHYRHEKILIFASVTICFVN